MKKKQLKRTIPFLGAFELINRMKSHNIINHFGKEIYVPISSLTDKDLKRGLRAFNKLRAIFSGKFLSKEAKAVYSEITNVLTDCYYPTPYDPSDEQTNSERIINLEILISKFLNYNSTTFNEYSVDIQLSLKDWVAFLSNDYFPFRHLAIDNNVDDRDSAVWQRVLEYFLNDYLKKYLGKINWKEDNNPKIKESAVKLNAALGKYSFDNDINYKITKLGNHELFERFSINGLGTVFTSFLWSEKVLNDSKINEIASDITRIKNKIASNRKVIDDLNIRIKKLEPLSYGKKSRLNKILFKTEISSLKKYKTKKINSNNTLFRKYLIDFFPKINILFQKHKLKPPFNPYR